MSTKIVVGLMIADLIAVALAAAAAAADQMSWEIVDLAMQDF